MRIKDKLEEIEEFLEELKDIIPLSFDEYKRNFEKKAACERYCEKIIEAVIDLAFLIIKDRGFKIPEEDKESFDILTNENIISQELSKRLKDAKGMRNIIAHEYGKIDDELVFQAITEELEKDIKDFINNIKKLFS